MEISPREIVFPNETSDPDVYFIPQTLNTSYFILSHFLNINTKSLTLNEINFLPV